MKEYCLFCVFLLLQLIKCDILCENGFCSNYEFETGCTAPAVHCVNNATHQGVSLPSPTICNCCQFCLPMIGENQPCTTGGVGSGLTVGRCGSGLFCLPTNGNSQLLTCQRMESPCHNEQDDYDRRHASGLTGALEERPRCDGKGKYAPFTCIPTQTCFCQSEDGERLFGEFQSSTTISTENVCGCSRLNHKIEKQIGGALRYPVKAPRCTFDGNFNPVQCINKKCYCVDKITGAIVGSQEINLDIAPISKLSCYDPSLDLFPEPPELGPPYNYTASCLKDQQESIDILLESEGTGYNIDYFTSVVACLPDGTFGRIGTLENRSKVCINEFGRRIENYAAQPDTLEFETMDCKCALTNLVMDNAADKPVCCKNGNFRKIQCRRGLCRCVDSEGRQTEKEVDDVTNLSCYTTDWRQC